MKSYTHKTPQTVVGERESGLCLCATVFLRMLALRAHAPLLDRLHYSFREGSAASQRATPFIS